MPDIPGPKAESPHNDGFLQAGKDALIYSLVQAPIDSINQITKHSIGNTLLTDLHIVDAPKQQVEGSAGAYGQMLGGLVGTLPYFYALSKMGGATTAKLAGVGTAESLGVEARMASAGASGFTYDALFHPVSASEEKNFWKSKGINAVTSGLTFAAMDGASGMANKFLSGENSRIFSGTESGARLARAGVSSGIAGLAGGLVSTESHSILSGNGLTTDNLGNNMATFALLGVGSAAIDAALAVHSTIARPESNLAKENALAHERPTSDTKADAKKSIRLPEVDATENFVQVGTDAGIEQWMGSKGTYARVFGESGRFSAVREDGVGIRVNEAGDRITYEDGIVTYEFKGRPPEKHPMGPAEWYDLRYISQRPLRGEEGDITQRSLNLWKERTISMRTSDDFVMFNDGAGNELILRPDGFKTFLRANGEKATYRMNAEDYDALKNFQTEKRNVQGAKFA